MKKRLTSVILFFFVAVKRWESIRNERRARARMEANVGGPEGAGTFPAEEGIPTSLFMFNSYNSKGLAEYYSYRKTDVVNTNLLMTTKKVLQKRSDKILRFYIYKRDNGIYYAKIVNPETKKVIRVKSTGQTDRPRRISQCCDDVEKKRNPARAHSNHQKITRKYE